MLFSQVRFVWHLLHRLIHILDGQNKLTCSSLEGDKSVSQKASDATSGSTSDNAADTGKSYLESAKDTISDATTQASDALSGM